MEKIIDISDYSNELNKLERAFYEVQARENILDIIIREGRKNTPYYEDMWEEYLAYLKNYNIIKYNFELNCIKKITQEQYYHWKVDFTKKVALLDE